MIQILIADDHLIVRNGLRQMLSGESDFAVAGEAGNGDDALRLIRSQPFDVVLMDMSMPGKSGFDLIAQIKIAKPKLAILVLSMYKEEQYAVRALKAGAMGYLSKESSLDQLTAAVRKVAGGGVYISPGVAERMALEMGGHLSAAPHTLLTDREFQIFKMIVAGMPMTAIAGQLSLSIKTVSTHKARMLQKMGLSNTADLIHYAIHHQLVEPLADK